jgi:type 1 glutamine amidotransferase
VHALGTLGFDHLPARGDAGSARSLLSESSLDPGRDHPGLAWTRAGRVFYNALGYFDGIWEDPGIRKLMLEAMLWLTGQDR